MDGRRLAVGRLHEHQLRHARDARAVSRSDRRRDARRRRRGDGARRRAVRAVRRPARRPGVVGGVPAHRVDALPLLRRPRAGQGALAADQGLPGRSWRARRRRGRPLQLHLGVRRLGARARPLDEGGHELHRLARVHQLCGAGRPSSPPPSAWRRTRSGSRACATRCCASSTPRSSTRRAAATRTAGRRATRCRSSWTPCRRRGGASTRSCTRC